MWSIHEYERGRALPSVTVLPRLASALGCPIDDLFVDAAGVFADAG